MSDTLSGWFEEKLRQLPLPCDVSLRVPDELWFKIFTLIFTIFLDEVITVLIDGSKNGGKKKKDLF